MESEEQISNFLRANTISESLYLNPLDLSHNGWWQIIKETLLQIKKEGWDGKIKRMREKEGLLSIEVAPGHSPKIYELLENARQKSMNICQKCGSSGTYEYTQGNRIVRCVLHKDGVYFYKKSCKCPACNNDRNEAKKYIQLDV